MTDNYGTKYPNLGRLIEIIKILRAPEGCPWDREQTHKTLRPNMLEEAYEAVDAIDEENSDLLCEELGDVLLQVVLHAQIAKDNNEFDEDYHIAFEKVFNTLLKKKNYCY